MRSFVSYRVTELAIASGEDDMRIGSYQAFWHGVS